MEQRKDTPTSNLGRGFATLVRDIEGKWERGWVIRVSVPEQRVLIIIIIIIIIMGSDPRAVKFTR
jgi:hypothetical protein